MTLTRRQALLALLGTAVGASQVEALAKVLPAIPSKAPTRELLYGRFQLTDEMLQAATRNHGAPDVLYLSPKAFEALQRDFYKEVVRVSR